MTLSDALAFLDTADWVKITPRLTCVTVSCWRGFGGSRHQVEACVHRKPGESAEALIVRAVGIVQERLQHGMPPPKPQPVCLQCGYRRDVTKTRRVCSRCMRRLPQTTAVN